MVARTKTMGAIMPVRIASKTSGTARATFSDSYLDGSYFTATARQWRVDIDTGTRPIDGNAQVLVVSYFDVVGDAVQMQPKVQQSGANWSLSSVLEGVVTQFVFVSDIVSGVASKNIRISLPRYSELSYSYTRLAAVGNITLGAVAEVKEEMPDVVSLYSDSLSNEPQKTSISFTDPGDGTLVLFHTYVDGGLGDWHIYLVEQDGRSWAYAGGTKLLARLGPSEYVDLGVEMWVGNLLPGIVGQEITIVNYESYGPVNAIAETFCVVSVGGAVAGESRKVNARAAFGDAGYDAGVGDSVADAVYHVGANRAGVVSFDIGGTVTVRNSNAFLEYAPPFFRVYPEETPFSDVVVESIDANPAGSGYYTNTLIFAPSPATGPSPALKSFKVKDFGGLVTNENKFDLLEFAVALRMNKTANPTAIAGVASPGSLALGFVSSLYALTLTESAGSSVEDSITRSENSPFLTTLSCVAQSPGPVQVGATSAEAHPFSFSCLVADDSYDVDGSVVDESEWLLIVNTPALPEERPLPTYTVETHRRQFYADRDLIPTIARDPESVVDYTFDWSHLLEGDTISTVAWEYEGVTSTSESNNLTSTTTVISSGAGEAKCTVTTAGGRTWVRRMRFVEREM